MTIICTLLGSATSVWNSVNNGQIEVAQYQKTDTILKTTDSTTLTKTKQVTQIKTAVNFYLVIAVIIILAVAYVIFSIARNVYRAAKD